jgi:hypothetical protein
MQSSNGKDPRARAASTLDSLGFFAARWDSAGPHILRVHAGPRATIDTIAILSHYALTMDSVARIRFPFPFDAGYVDRLAQRTVREYAARGFPFAGLSVAVEPRPAPSAGTGSRMLVRFSVDPDERCAFGDPLLVGFSRTRASVLRHDIRIRPGGLFDISKVEESLDRLLSRPYVAAASAGGPRLASAVPAAVRADAMPRAVVPFVITERSGLGIDGVVGFRSDADDRARFTGDLTVSLLNTLGYGEQADLSYHADKDQQRLDVSGGLPWVAGSPLHLLASAGLEVKEDDYGYVHGSARLLTELRPRLQGGIGIRGFRNEAAASPARTCIGGDLVVRRLGETPARGEWSRELDMVLGSGITSASGMRHTRWSAEFATGIHIPLQWWGVHLRIVSDNLISAEDSIPAVELYRVGGYRSVRGYADEVYPFRSVAYEQAELLLYFARTGAVYILCDGGIGFHDSFTMSDRTDLLGYGIGARFGTKIGAFSVEWARNIDDTRSLGRILLRFRNPLSMEARP